MPRDSTLTPVVVVGPCLRTELLYLQAGRINPTAEVFFYLFFPFFLREPQKIVTHLENFDIAALGVLMLSCACLSLSLDHYDAINWDKDLTAKS